MVGARVSKRRRERARIVAAVGRRRDGPARRVALRELGAPHMPAVCASALLSPLGARRSGTSVTLAGLALRAPPRRCERSVQ
eukprot:4015625-Prymnesium_polylepis.1